MSAAVVRLSGSLRAWRLPGILLLAVFIRLVNISSRGLQYDDVFSIFLSRRSLGEIVQGTAADTMPPLYYFLLHYWMKISGSVWFIRSLSVILSLIAVYLTYRFVIELAGEKAGLWAAFLMAISPLQYYHAQDVRNYALLLCTQLGYYWCFARWQKANAHNRGAMIGLVLTGVAAMYTHNVAIFGLLVADIYLVLKRQWRSLRDLVIAQAIIALLALPWLWLVPGQVAKVQRAWWQVTPGLVEAIQVPVVWSAGLPLGGAWLGVGLFLGLAILALVIVEIRRHHRHDPGIQWLGGIALITPGLMLVVSYLVRPIFVPRGFIVAHAAYAGLCGTLIAAGWQRGAGKLLLGGFILAALVGLPAQATYDGFPRSPFEQAASYVERNLVSGEVVIHDNKLSYFPFRFYQPDLPQVFIADIPGSGNDTFAEASQEAMKIYPEPDLVTAVGGASRVDFVVFSQAVDEYRALGQTDHPHLAWLRAHYHEAGVDIFNDLEVHRFEKP